MSTNMNDKLQNQIDVLTAVAEIGVLSYNKALARGDALDANYWLGGLDVVKEVLVCLQEIHDDE